MEERLKKFRKLLSVEKLDAYLICTVHNIQYLTGFSGFSAHEREGYLLVTQTNAYIFTDPRLSEGARNGTNPKVISIVELNAHTKLSDSLQKVINSEHIKTIGFEEHLTHYEYLKFKKLKDVTIKLSEELIETLREVKDKDELENIRLACELTDKTFAFILKNIKLGMSELDIAWEMEKFIRDNKGTLAFPTIVAFGKNSAVPHHATSDQRLKTNDIILLDFGAQIKGYCADMTRTVFFGNPEEKFKTMYEAVREGQEKGFETKTDGKNPTCDEIDKAARNYIVSKGFPSVPHSVGHGVGLQVHELPHISMGFTDEILPNTPFTIEPGIYINGYGGVRIEDTVYFNGTEIITLTKSPKELLQI